MKNKLINNIYMKIGMVRGNCIWLSISLTKIIIAMTDDEIVTTGSSPAHNETLTGE